MKTDDDLIKELKQTAYRLSMINAADRGWDGQATSRFSKELERLKRACDERGIDYDLSGYLV